MIARSGRLILIKSMVTARSIHQFFAAEASYWMLEELDRWLCAFFWVDKDKVNGGKCLVAWDQVCKPTSFGSLGVKNLRL
jgi:hypothetical protein